MFGRVERVFGPLAAYQSGSIHRAPVRLMKGGRKLVVCGHVLVSVHGRSQTWLRDLCAYGLGPAPDDDLTKLAT